MPTYWDHLRELADRLEKNFDDKNERFHIADLIEISGRSIKSTLTDKEKEEYSRPSNG